MIADRRGGGGHWRRRGNSIWRHGFPGAIPIRSSLAVAIAPITNPGPWKFDFERELQVMGKGQALITTSYKDVPLPVMAPDYDKY